MIYQSTRSKNLTADSLDAVLSGIAPDGGLYIADPSQIAFDWKACLELSPVKMSAMILKALLPDIPDMDALVSESYKNKFETDDLVPMVKVGNRWVLELFRGPTCAFKDVALSVLPRLITGAKAAKGQNEKTVILTATSGDTGKAALEGFKDVPGTEIFVFYPHKGVSLVQELQMSTQEGSNVKVCSVYGNFDDAQTAVKETFGKLNESKLSGVSFSSANSINIGRLAPQVMYYFKAYKDMLSAGAVKLGEKVNFSVPTGNFGDILAGYYAKLLGLPVGKLICASNSNNVLTDFIKTGCYDKRRDFYKTTSPSMDILVSSNLERMLFLLCHDEEKVAAMMKDLKEKGVYSVPEDMKQALSEVFEADFCTDEEAAASINSVFTSCGYLFDPHTAAAWKAADSFLCNNENAPLVVLSTASFYKFPEAVVKALGKEPSGSEFSDMERLSKLTNTPVPPALAGLSEKKVLHSDVIDPKDMHSYVCGRI